MATPYQPLWATTSQTTPHRRSAPITTTTASDPQVDDTTRQFFHHTAAKRVDTDAVIAKSLKRQYPNLELSISPSWNVDLLGFASAGFASFTTLDDAGPGLPSSLIWTGYIPPARRLDGNLGGLSRGVQYGKFLYKWGDAEFILYIVDGRDGTSAYPPVRNNYLLTSDLHKADALLVAAGKWGNELHDEIWVYDGGWGKSAELYDSVKKATWDAVILDPKMKKALINDHLSFYDSRATYSKLKVPWKRGIIYHGPPGNGKTISIKAMMHTLYNRKDDPVPALYVRNFVSWMGPEAAIGEIFNKARSLAPCYLIFEDLDSLVMDSVRSYFLNEVDGLKGNDGIFMIGSTNHLERLDPGISKRPSRFDRKYYFPDPDVEQRIAYAHFWQGKLADNKDIEFPDELCKAIADITDGFSFAYMQEAFVASLLAIARRGQQPDGEEFDEGDFEKLKINDSEDEEEDGTDWVELGSKKDAVSWSDIKDLVLWVEIQKQVAILREGMDNEKGSGKN